MKTISIITQGYEIADMLNHFDVGGKTLGSNAALAASAKPTTRTDKTQVFSGKELLYSVESREGECDAATLLEAMLKLHQAKVLKITTINGISAQELGLVSSTRRAGANLIGTDVGRGLVTTTGIAGAA